MILQNFGLVYVAFGNHFIQFFFSFIYYQQFGWFANPIFSETGGFPPVMIENINKNSMDEGRKWSRLPEFTDEQKAFVKGNL